MKKLLLVVCIAVLLCGCGKKEEYLPGLERIEDFKGYEKRNEELRIDVVDAKKQYREQIEKLGSGTERFRLDECKYEELSQFDNLSIINTEVTKLKVSDAKKHMIELMNASGIDGESEYKRVKYTFNNKVKDEAFLIDVGDATLSTEKVDIMYLSDGLYSYADNSICEYLNEIADIKFTPGSIPSGYWIGEYGTIEKSGKVSELSNETYELINGKHSVGDMAKQAVSFMQKNVIYDSEKVVFEAVSVDIVRVGDKYVYLFYMGRRIDDISFDQVKDRMSFIDRSHTINKMYIQGEFFQIMSSGGDNVGAYIRMLYTPVKYEKVKTFSKMIDLKNAVSIAQKEVAKELQITIKNTGLYYVPLECVVGKKKSFDSTGKEMTIDEYQDVIIPCWVFDGDESISGSNIRIFVDAISGDFYCMTYKGDSSMWSM